MYLLFQPSKITRYKRKTGFVDNLFQAGSVCLLASALSACTVTKQMSSLVEEDNLVTGSVSEPVKKDGVESTDADVIKEIVADTSAEKAKSNVLAWSNPDTGNRGTIVAIDKFVGSHGQKCKKFQTTIDSFVGISLYDGETCEVKRGMWVLSWFTRR